MLVIFDVVLVFDGIVVDVGYVYCFGYNLIFEQLQDDLMDYCDMIVWFVKECWLMVEVVQEVDVLCCCQGVELCYKVYLFKVFVYCVVKIYKLLKLCFVVCFGLNVMCNLLFDQGCVVKQ